MIAVLDGIFLQKHEPAVRDLRDELIKPTTIATLCILTDVTMMTNTMQKYPQSSRLNILGIPREKEKLIEKLNAKYDSPSDSSDSYFGKLESFFNIAKQSIVTNLVQTKTLTLHLLKTRSSNLSSLS